MKKTYRPLDRVEKQSQIYRKKTLNLNDDLNIKHDEDNIENVEDYWNTALSVIGNSTADSFDESTESKISDTLFNIKNIRQSIKNNKKNLPVKTNETINDTDLQPWNDIEKPEEKKINKEEKDLIRKKKINEFRDAIADTSVEISSQNEENFVNIKKSKNIEKVKDNDKIDEPFLFENDIDNEFLNSETLKIKQEIKPVNKDEMLTSFETKKKPAEAIKEKPDIKKKAKVDKILGKEKNNGSFVIEQALKETPNNKISPLVCTSSINTAMMTLDYLAYFNDFQTENSFSIFVLKGQIKMSVNGKEKMAKKGDITIIEKNDVFSCDCQSRNGAKMLLSYAL